ncbi:GerAB/ArcD/ProY family transporter [Pseudobacillus badius]|uniref:GerAB/ArcD/ProY family transporter n=1 Tax=Bacillus badius TaxID=1455 RepID=UPI003D3287AF
MLEKGRISAVEFQIIVITFTIGSTILIAPAPLISLAKQDAWISSCLTTFIGIFFIFLYNQISKLYPSLTYVECNEKVFGKVLGKITSSLFLLYFFEISTATLREIGDFFTSLILVETPIEIIMLLFILTNLIGVRLGLEVISRSLLIFFPWIIMLLFFLTLFLIPEIKVENIQPILEGGIKPVLKGTFHQLGIPYLQLIIFLMITPYVNEKANMRKYFYKGMVIGGMVLLIVILLCIWVLNVKLTSFQSYPVYTLGKKINVANFFNRIEVVVAIIWVITTYFKLTICFYGLSLGLAQMINLKNYQILLFPLSLLIFSMSIFFYPDVVFFNDFALKAFIPFSLIICFILPLSLLITAKVRAKITKQ